ncbi:BCL2/adenovirus E1B protein-interacting protein 2 [Camelus ferus]|nr:BCL2/adenovirus E1B protein-interacting protein 2 [Camelus ferus]
MPVASQPGRRHPTPHPLSSPSPGWRGEEDEEAKASSGDIGSLDYQESIVDIESRLRMEGVELKEEWQDEDFPIPLPEDDSIEADILAVTGPESQPGSVEVNGNKVRKKLMAPDISLTLDPSDGSVLSDDLDESGEIDLDGLDTPSEDSNEFEWEDDLPKPKTTEVIRKGSITEYSTAEEKEDGRRWRMFRIGEQDHRVDMKAIEPYKKVISHGGYYGDGLNAIVVFAVCFMPESGQPNYRYLMDNLFKVDQELNGKQDEPKTIGEMDHKSQNDGIDGGTNVLSQQITPQLALQVLLQFDKAINSALAQRVRNRVNFRGSLNTYRFCDNVWTFVLNDVEFREVTELIKVDKVKIVACDGKNTGSNTTE